MQPEQIVDSEMMVSLFDPLNQNIRINEALAVCVGLEIFRGSDSFNGNEICVDCMRQLEIVYNFRKLCWKSQYEWKMSKVEDYNDDQVCVTAFNYPNNFFLIQRNQQKKIETPEIPINQPQSTSDSTYYEFVDTNRTQNNHVDETVASEHVDHESSNLDDCTNRFEKLKSFKCSICMKQFRKYMHMNE